MTRRKMPLQVPTVQRRACLQHKPQVCHGRGNFSTAPWTRCARSLWLALLLGLSACTAQGPTFWLAPLGHHEVQVGEPWSHSLQVQGRPQAPLQWRLLRGPVGAQLIVDGAGPRLYWLPDVLRLGWSAPGQPRKPGNALPVAVELSDASGEKATAVGELVVVPTPQP